MSEIVGIEEVSSTNDWLLERALAGAPDGLWVRADVQTAGRGRRGRSWSSGRGNLMASGLVRLQPEDGPAQQLSLITAIALHEALSAHADADRFRLKWPNDLHLDGRKCAGILIEASGRAVVIGIGANLVSHPPDSERPAISLLAAGIDPPQPADLLTSIVGSFDRMRIEWQHHGFAPVRARWLAAATGLGQLIEARLHNETVSGRFEGLNEDGALLMQLPDGRIRAIHSGEVFLLDT